MTHQRGLILVAWTALLLSISACDDAPTAGPAESTGQSAVTASAPPSPPGMIWVPAGTFTMGYEGDDGRPDEAPAHRVHVDGFFIDETEVTNAQFRAFVEATGYVTTAERPVEWEQLKQQLPPGTPKPADEMLQPGSAVFVAPRRAVPMGAYGEWWAWTHGADWQHPQGPGSSIEGKDDHPVVHISWYDAVAYAKWAGKQLPTEAQWERAARYAQDNQRFAWGDELTPGDKHMANIWQGRFPYTNAMQDGHLTTAPVKTFPPNALGLYDMAGNVWEWTADRYRPDTYQQRVVDGAPNSPPANSPPADGQPANGQAGACCQNPGGPGESFSPRDPYASDIRVQKGGSFLCHASYCSSYRPSAKMGTTPDSTFNHTGFRCVVVPATTKSSPR